MPQKATFSSFLILVVLLLAAAASAYRVTASSSNDNCHSENLRELILEAVGMYPHQPAHQAKYMKQEAEARFGSWWSAVVVSDRGGYGMSAVYDNHRNTSCELVLFDTFYWLGRTC